MAGVTFIAGTSLGGACGYAMGSQQTGGVVAGPEEKPKDEPLVSSGNAELDELRRLAVKAPIEELMGLAPAFVDEVRSQYGQDPVLWQGVARICDAVLAGHQVGNTRLFARSLAQVIETADPKFTTDLLPRLQKLRSVK